MLPTFIVLGGQKAASTFIQECLEAHPEVFIAEGEQSFFEDAFYRADDLSSLEALFAEAGGYKAVGLRRADYLYSHEVADRIKKTVPDVKLIMTLRHPVERLVSAIYHYMRYNMIPISTMDESINKLLDGMYLEDYPRSEEILRYSKYNDPLSHYLSLFGKDKCHVILYDDIRKDREQVIKRLYRFLDVDTAQLPKWEKVNRYPGIYSLFRLKIIATGNRFWFYLLHGRYFRPRPWGVKRIVGFVIKAIDKYILARFVRSEKASIRQATYERLAKELEADIDKLETTLNLNLAHWKKPPKSLTLR